MAKRKNSDGGTGSGGPPPPPSDSHSGSGPPPSTDPSSAAQREARQDAREAASKEARADRREYEAFQDRNPKNHEDFAKWNAAQDQAESQANAQLDLRLAQAKAEKALGSATYQRDARSIITNILRSYGLQSLDKWAWSLITQNASIDQITTELYQQPLFKQRFPGIIYRQEHGLPPISITSYIALEDSYEQLVTQYGLPRSILTPAFMGNLVGQDVSPSEFNDRIVKGYSFVQQAPASVQQTFAQWFGVKGMGQLAHYFLDPKNNAAVLEHEAMMAQVQGAGVNAGVNIGRNRAAQLAEMGDTYQQVQSALGGLTKTAGLFQANQAEGAMSAGIRGVVGQAAHLTESNQGVSAALGLSATAEQEVQQRANERQASFKGGGGAAQQGQQGYIGLGSAKSE